MSQQQFLSTTPPNESASISALERAQDDADPTYNPLADKTKVNTTPSSRVDKLKEKTASPAAKSRVDKATSDLTGSRCLIENTSDRNVVEYAHCFARTTSSTILDNLEYSWALDANTLNLDTRQNMFRVSIKFHRLFDRGLWILIPEEKIVDTYFKALPGTKPTKLPKIHPSPYTYTVVFHRDMRPVPLLRQKDETINEETHENINDSLAITDFDFLTYPLSGITVQSHLHPRYVICSLGWTMTKCFDIAKEPVGEAYQDSQSGHSNNLLKILSIYNLWSTLYDTQSKLGIPAALEFAASLGGKPKAARTDDNSNFTAPGRALRSHMRQQLNSDPQGSSNNDTSHGQGSQPVLHKEALASGTTNKGPGQSKQAERRR